MYEYIVNPVTKRRVKVTGKLGQKILRGYIKQVGAGKVRFKKQNTCGSGHRASTIGLKLNMPWFIATDATAWDWSFPQTQRKICKHIKYSHPGPKTIKRKLYKQCKNICPKKTYLGYSPKIENSKGKVIKERGWCCYDNPLDKNVANIKKNFLKEKRIHLPTSTRLSKTPLNKPSKKIIKHMRTYFKELDKLTNIPKKFKHITYEDVIEFKNNVLTDLYDAGDTGKTKNSFRKLILEELTRISENRRKPKKLIVKRTSPQKETASIFDMMSGDDAW